MRIRELLSLLPRPLLANGAFGTYYRSLYHRDSLPELANLQNPRRVLEIHEQYLQAGANLLYSNTFALSSLLYLEQERLQALIEAGLSLARQAAGHEAAVLADIGPVDSLGREQEQVQEDYLRLAELFLAAGAQDFVFETIPRFSTLAPALALIREKQPTAFILVTFAVSQDGYSKKGSYYRDLLDAAFACPQVDASGLNCACGPTHLSRLLATYAAPGKLLAALPNAGYPVRLNQNLHYEDNPRYFAESMISLARQGCFMLGGCCGTTPAHIARLRQELNALAPASGPAPAEPIHILAPPAPAEKGTKDGFAAKLQRGEQGLVVELNPPLTTNTGHFLQAAHQAQQAGVDIISVTDSPLARVRADSIMMAAKLRRELGIEVLPHLSCRDRNRLGLKAALLGAAIEDIHYVLAVRGDAAPEGVFNLNSRELMKYIASLNRELFGGEGFCVGGALNINATNFPAELKRAQVKEEAGCAFFLTQPVMEERGLENIAKAVQELKTPVLAGILPLAGYKNALFLEEEVSGINIPPELLKGLEQAQEDKERCRELSLGHCRQLIEQLKPLCGGFYFMTPLNKIEWVCELVAEVKK